MTMTEMRKAIFEMLAELCEREDILNDPEMELLDSNVLDSLSLILLLNRIDDEFGIEIQPTQVDFAVFKTPGSIADYVEKLANE